MHIAKSQTVLTKLITKTPLRISSPPAAMSFFSGSSFSCVPVSKVALHGCDLLVCWLQHCQLPLPGNVRASAPSLLPRTPPLELCHITGEIHT